MMRIIVNGALGHMGQKLIHAIAQKPDRYELVAQIDVNGNGVDVLTDIQDYTGEADVIIDFSHHSVAPALCAYAMRRAWPLVIATTGHTSVELAAIETTAKAIPVFFSPNMSLGVALTADLAKRAARAFPDADIEIVETHHNRKLDAPSGTALLLASAIESVRPEAIQVHGRSGRSPRTHGEIGIHSIRRGNVVGIHEILISTGSETITIQHEAHDRALFADGALVAAEFIVDRPAGQYDLSHLF